jgi:hypothetical protein
MTPDKQSGTRFQIGEKVTIKEHEYEVVDYNPDHFETDTNGGDLIHKNMNKKEIIAKFEKYMSERHAAAPPASILVPALNILYGKNDMPILKIKSKSEKRI